MGKLAAVGWLLAIFASLAAVGEFYWFPEQQKAALAAQATEYEAKLAQAKAEAAAAMKKAQDDATAAQLVLQTELDFQKLPEIPLKTQFRANQVLYVENELDETFNCKVRVFRPATSKTQEFDFEMKSRTFRDMGAIESWVFARGDKVEFAKSGYKPRSLEAP
jgi:hypothetical protein